MPGCKNKGLLTIYERKLTEAIWNCLVLGRAGDPRIGPSGKKKHVFLKEINRFWSHMKSGQRQKTVMNLYELRAGITKPI